MIREQRWSVLAALVAVLIAVGFVPALTPVAAAATSSVVSSSPRVTEGNSGTRPATFTISGTCGDPAGCTISGNTQTGTPGPGTATAGEDFADTVYSYQVSGTFSQDVMVNVNGDTKVEQDEQFQLNVSLADSTGTRVAADQGTATIVNDDSAAPPDPRADLAATLTVPATAPAGSTFPVTLTVANRGPGPATQVQSVINTPGMRITSAAGGTITSSGTTAQFVTPNIPSGQSATYQVTVTTDRTVRGAQNVNATTSASSPDPNTANNAAQQRVTITAPR